jgi:uncharacterized repeat protein (TIGR02543 family)
MKLRNKAYHFQCMTACLLALLIVAGPITQSPVLAQTTLFTVTFDSRNGLPVAKVIVESGKPVARPADPVRSGYIFAGWHKDSSRVYDFNFATLITANRTLYADWTYIETNPERKAGSLTLKLADLSQWNDTLASSTDNIDFVALKSTLDAVYLRAASYSDARGGIYTDDQVASYVQRARAAGLPFGFYIYLRPQADPAVSVKQASYFYNLIKQYPYRCIPVIDIEYDTLNEPAWTLTGAQVTASVAAFAAEFKRLSGQEPMIYTYLYYANTYLGSELGKYRLWIANYNTTAPGNTSSWTEYDMWQYTSKALVSGVPAGPIDMNRATTNILLKTVTFNSQGGSAVNSFKASYHSTIPVPAEPTRTGYTFKGWYRDAACTLPWYFATQIVTANTTIYAGWQPLVYTVAFDYQNGGERLINPAEFGSALPAPTPAPVREGYRFVGWYKDAALTIPWDYSSDTVAGHTTLYARWLADPVAKVAARSVNYQSIKVTWGAAAGANAYELYQATNSAGPFTRIKTLPAGTLTFTPTGLATGQLYYFKVRAYALNGSSKVYNQISAGVAARPVPAVPGSFKVVRLNASSITVSWAKVTGASGYDIYRKIGATGSFSLRKRTADLSFTNTGLTKGTTYYYRVRAYRLVGTTKVNGPFTMIGSVTP